MSKADQLKALAIKRRRTRWPGYRQVGDFHGGVYESDCVSPYTKSGRNFDAEVFLLLQDWSSESHLSGPLQQPMIDLGRSPDLPTNQKLEELLESHFGLALADTYATNLFPFVKPGLMSARIRMRDLVAAAREFAIPQIEIVQPRLVVCLGLATYRAVQSALNSPTAPGLESAISSPLRVGEASVWCQAHTGALGQANRNRGGIDRVEQDWRSMARSFHGGA